MPTIAQINPSIKRRFTGFACGDFFKHSFTAIAVKIGAVDAITLTFEACVYERAMDIMEPTPVVCSPEMTIPDLYKVFTKNDCDAIAIVDADNKAMGVIEKAAIDHFLHQQVIALHKKIASLG